MIEMLLTEMARLNAPEYSNKEYMKGQMDLITNVTIGNQEYDEHRAYVERRFEAISYSFDPSW